MQYEIELTLNCTSHGNFKSSEGLKYPAGYIIGKCPVCLGNSTFVSAEFREYDDDNILQGDPTTYDNTTDLDNKIAEVNG